MKSKIQRLFSEKRNRKSLFIAVLLTVLYGLEIFVLSGFAGALFGIWGTVLHEIVLALIGVGIFIIFHGKMKVIYPFHKPKWDRTIGTILLWIGTYFATIFVTMIMNVFFSSEMEAAGESVSRLIEQLPIGLGILIVAVTPAICEELAFRGALLSCFRFLNVRKTLQSPSEGAKAQTRGKWIGILIVSCIFGAFHGSIFRMIPTAMLGVAMGYLLFETENMFYNMLFHFINNAVPVIMLGISNLIYSASGFGEELMESAQSGTDSMLLLQSVASSLRLAACAPILIYLGNHLIHRGKAGYERGLFPKEKRPQVMLLFLITVVLWGLGLFMQIALMVLEKL